MAMYYYASKLSAMACGIRCKQTIIQRNRGLRDRDKCDLHDCKEINGDDDDEDGDRSIVRVSLHENIFSLLLSL